jgi:hypothetical protein
MSKWTGWGTLSAAAVLVLASWGVAAAQTQDPTEALKPNSILDEAGTQDTPRSYGFFEVICKSAFGQQPDPQRVWTPLTLSDLSEGWFEPWIAPPNPTGGSRRQGWVNTYDAFFNRMIVGIDSYTIDNPAQQREQVGTLLYETPITRRYMFGIFVPFVDNLQNGSLPQVTAFGDLTLENRFILRETQDFTLSFNLNGRVPTGDPALGGKRTSINPYLSFFKDLGRGFSLRGTGGIDRPVDGRPDGITSTLIGQLGLGQTLTPHDVPLFGDFTYYVTANYREYFGPGTAFLSLTPGFRTHLSHNFWLLGGVEVPVAHPVPFQERFTMLLVKGF